MPGPPIDWQKLTLFVFGTVFLLGLLAIALFDRQPSQTSWHIYNSVLAMAAGGIAALVPGTLSLKWKSGLTATGALAVAMIVFYAGKNVSASNAMVQDLKSYLVFRAQDELAASPYTSDVYVVINSHVAAFDLVSSTAELKITDGKRGKDVSIVRGPGGVRVDFKTLLQGDKIFVAQKDRSRWWKSPDMIIPEAELQMSEVPLEAIAQRVNAAR
jgi:hypothetical protein